MTPGNPDISYHRNSTVCFSGHRKLKIPGRNLFNVPDSCETNAKLEAMIMRRIAAAVEKAYGEGKTHFLCGMAEGFDLLAGLAVLEVRERFPDIRLTCVIPYPGQSRNFSREDKAAYNRIVEESDHRLNISPVYAPDCFHRRNDYMVRNSGTLICWYDGSPGGTFYTVKAAVRNRLKLYNLYDDQV